VLSRFEVSGFKSFASPASLPLAPMTVLIGANASGKTNLIEALSLMSALGTSTRLSDLQHRLRDKTLAIRGRVAEFLADSEQPIKLRCEFTFGYELELSMRLMTSSPGEGAALRIVGEKLVDPRHSSTLPLYEVVAAAAEHGSELTVEYNNFKRGRNKPQIHCVDDQAVFTQLRTPARFNEAHTESQSEIPRACENVTKVLSEVLVLDPVPSQMRDYAFLDEVELRADGANVSSVLRHLVVDEGAMDEVLNFVRALPEQNIRSLDFITGPRNEVMVQVVESFGDRERRTDASTMSDGTLRVLAIAAAILSVNIGTVVVIEEVDNGVHPSRAEMLMKTMHRIATARGIRLIITTHNPALLDAVPDRAIGDVVACYRDPSTGESRLQRLRDLGDDYVRLTAEGPLGVLATSGALDRYLKQRRTEDERKRQLAETLELFRSTGSE
jgi:predicted ATPase